MRQAIAKMTHWPNSLLLPTCRHKQVPSRHPAPTCPGAGVSDGSSPSDPSATHQNQRKTMRETSDAEQPFSELGSTSPGQAEALTPSHLMWTELVWTKAPGMPAQGTAES